MIYTNIDSRKKSRSIDQLDKADTPAIPDAYIYLLGLQCIVSICECFAALTLPVFNAIVVQRSRAAGESVIKAPPALDITSLPDDQPSTAQLRAVHGMVEAGWPALLAALSFLIATNLADELFGDVVQSYQNVANVAGMLGLTTPRDAFLTSLGKFAIPSRVVSSLDSYTHTEPPQTPRVASAISDGLSALAGGPAQPPGLSDRNMACLKVLATSTLFLAGSLGPAWYNVLEALQNADYVLTAKGQRSAPLGKRSSSGNTSGLPASGLKSSSSMPSATQVAAGAQAQPRHPLLADLDSESVQRAIQRLFDSSKNMDDTAFHDFVSALCKLSLEMVDMQSNAGVVLVETSDTSESLPTLSPTTDNAHRRRVSGIHLPHTLVSRCIARVIRRNCC